MAKPFKKITSDLADLLVKLDGNAVKVWLYHYAHSNVSDEYFPSLDTICEATGLCEDTALKARTTLRNCGFFAKTGERNNKGKFKVPVYKCITDPAIIPNGADQEKVRDGKAARTPKVSGTDRSGKIQDRSRVSVPKISGSATDQESFGTVVDGISRAFEVDDSSLVVDQQGIVDAVASALPDPPACDTANSGNQEMKSGALTSGDSGRVMPVIPPVSSRGEAAPTLTPALPSPLPWEVSDAAYLANYLWMFLVVRKDIEILKPWERFWTEDFQHALDWGYSKEDIELAILASQFGKSRQMYVRAKSIIDNLELLIEKGNTLRAKGFVTEESECQLCHGFFATDDDMWEHQDEDCDCIPEIDPADAVEEEMMYAAEALISEGLSPDPDPGFDPWHDERGDEDWSDDYLFDPWVAEDRDQMQSVAAQENAGTWLLVKHPTTVVFREVCGDTGRRVRDRSEPIDAATQGLRPPMARPDNAELSVSPPGRMRLNLCGR